MSTRSIFALFALLLAATWNHSHGQVNDNDWNFDTDNLGLENSLALDFFDEDDNALFLRKYPLTDQEERFLFDRFLNKFGKLYEHEEERQRRLLIFRRNLFTVNLLNQHEQASGVYGVTQFTDLTKSEFQRMYTGLRPEFDVDLTDHEEARNKALELLDTEQPLPQSYDWRSTPGVVSEVKDQGMCGSCWAFSTTGNIEGIWRLRKNKTVELSEQELVDCDSFDGGCDGGLMTNAYKSIIESLKGLEGERDYPYDGWLSEGCRYNKSLVRVTIDSYVVLPTNETQLAQWLVQRGPISIGINAAAMQFYIRGVSHPPGFLCNSKKIDHGVLLVGFGYKRTLITRKLQPFWIVKNSWGANWGNHGYYFVYRGDGTCGVNTMASSAWVN